MLNSILCACIWQAVHTFSLYLYTTISVGLTQLWHLTGMPMHQSANRQVTLDYTTLQLPITYQQQFFSSKIHLFKNIRSTEREVFFKLCQRWKKIEAFRSFAFVEIFVAAFRCFWSTWEGRSLKKTTLNLKQREKKQIFSGKEQLAFLLRNRGSSVADSRHSWQKVAGSTPTRCSFTTSGLSHLTSVQLRGKWTVSECWWLLLGHGK